VETEESYTCCNDIIVSVLLPYGDGYNEKISVGIVSFTACNWILDFNIKDEDSIFEI